MKANRAFLLSVLLLTGLLGGAVGAVPALADGIPTSLSYQTQPGPTEKSNQVFTVTVQLLDDVSQPIAGTSVTVSLSGGTPGANLGGTTTQVTDSSGIATFNDLSVDKAGTGYTLDAAASSLNASSSSFDVTAGGPTQLSFTQQPPPSAKSDQKITATLQVLDAQNNPVSGSSVTVALSGGDPAATLAGTKTKTTNASGNATFTGLSVDKVGTNYLLIASDPDIPGTEQSSAFDITPGAVDHLTFTTQPASGIIGQALPDIVVQAQDLEGNQVAGSGVATIALANNPSGATLAGTLSESPGNTSQDWSFDGLTIDKPGIGYTLTVTAMGLTSDPTSPFTVKGTPTVKVSVNHSTITAGTNVTVTVTLSACQSPCSVKPTVTYTYADNSTVTLPPVTWDHVHRIGRLVVPRSRNGKFVAHYAGDGLYVAADSQTPAALHVHALVSDVLVGGYAFRSGYRLFHYQPSCPPKPHRLCPQISATVMPPKVGKTVHFFLQAYLSGKWSTIQTLDSSKWTNGRTGAVWYYANRSVIGYRLRTRATYSGDPDSLSGVGPWRYFTITY